MIKGEDDLDLTAPGAIGGTTPYPGRFGQASNYTDISAGGVITWAGTAKRKFTRRPRLNQGLIGVKVKPVQVAVGAWQYFRMPIFNSDDQQVFYTMRCPYRWDGTTNPVFKAMVGIESEETAGKVFQFKLLWNTTSITGQMETATLDVLSGDIAVLAAPRNAALSMYSVSFELDYDSASLQQTLVARNNISFCLQRVAKTAGGSTEIAGNAVLQDAVVEFAVDKVYGTW
jgi:hypothetical protein